MRLAAGHFRMRTSSSALDARVLLAAEAWIARRASHDLSRCLRTGRLHELSAGALLTRGGMDRPSSPCPAAGPTWPLPSQNALITVAITLVLAAGRDGLRDQSLGSRPMYGCRWTASYTDGLAPDVERRVAVAAMSKESAYWTPRERFPSTSTVGGDLENGAEHSGSRGFADTEEDGGSTPPAPTTP